MSGLPPIADIARQFLEQVGGRPGVIGLAMGKSGLSAAPGRGLDIRLATASRIDRFDCSFHEIEKGTVVFQGGEKATALFFGYAATRTLFCGGSKNTAQVYPKEIL
jgi:hypothetical protein